MIRLPPAPRGRPRATVGSPLWASAALVSAGARSFRSRAFRAPPARELLFSAWPEKSNQKRGHPAWRFPPIPGWKVREPEPGFSAVRPCTVEKASASCRCPLRGLIVSVSPPHRGPEQRARSCAHSSKDRQGCGIRSLRRRSRRAPSAGQDGPPAFRGPLCGGEAGTTRPAGCSAGEGMDARVEATHGAVARGRAFLDSTGMCCRETRPSLTDFPGRMPGKRQAGCPSLWLLSLGQARESDSPSEGARNALDLKDRAPAGTRASPVRKGLPTVASALPQKGARAMIVGGWKVGKAEAGAGGVSAHR